MKTDNEFGKRLKQMREFKKLTQNELAQILVVSDKTISKWENGGSIPDVDILKRISEYFSVSMDYLLSGITNAISDVVSKIELACREDNIALLDGVDLSEVDIYGKNIEYYIDKYNPPKVNRYYYDVVTSKWVEENEDKECPLKFYICALEKDSESDDNLRFVKAVKKEQITSTCKELEEKKGYHGFKVFYALDFIGKTEIDYQYMDINFLNPYGKLVISLNVTLLNDYKSAIAGFCVYGEKKETIYKTDFYVSEENMSLFLKTMNDVDLKSWENKHWGYSIFNVFFTLKNKPSDIVLYEKLYLNPGKDKYNAFKKAILKYIVSSASLTDQKVFYHGYCGDEEPYCREGLSYEQSEKVFKAIEEEMEELKEYGNPKIV